MQPALTIQIVYFDQDIFELRVIAANGDFSGTVNVYVGIGDLEIAADALEGFPKKPFDQRAVELGTFRDDSAGGGAHLSFHCIDHAGHIQLRLRMQTDCHQNIPPQSIALHLATDPACIDTFVEDLRRMETDLEHVAILRTS